MTEIVIVFNPEFCQVVPHYYLSVELNLGNIMSMREHFNKNLKKGEEGLSVMDFLVKAAALAMKEVDTVKYLNFHEIHFYYYTYQLIGTRC
jgi:pyruvate dehydrogenase E2 component (dihydrolipoamide acetyltransferase)